MKLSSKDRLHYLNFKKGYEGEKVFDLLVDTLECECLLLHDLLLKLNNTLFQIDTMVILQDAVYLFEIKNYEGDFYYESDRL
ncbi:nuclease-related domain-containing protein [Halalkalibacter akibai]|uniref:nuclease-related domain-containing protein n=1 Tax=Halalkalibacter akibai TaxID=1411 RepID=UPI000AD43B6B